MKISTKARYALIALIDIAQAKDGRASLQEIALRQNISRPYLEQIFLELRRSGIVESVRGPRGGYRLSKKAQNIKVVDILISVEEIISALHTGAGSGGGKSGSKAQSLSNRFWETVSARVYVLLHGVSLADIAKNTINPCRAVPMLFD